MHTATEVVRSYRRARGSDDAARAVVRRLAAGVLRVAGLIPPHPATGWLDDVLKLCRDEGLTDEASALTLRLEAAQKQATASMATYSTKIEVTAEERAALERELLKGGPGPALSRLVRWFLPRRAETLQKLKEAAAQFPLLHLLEHQLADEAHVRARVGGVHDDEEGQLLLKLRETIQFSALHLHIALRAVVTQYGFTGAAFVDVMRGSPAFDPSHAALMGIGFDHYVQSDFISSLHLLVPQFEHFLRGILKAGGKSQSKRVGDGVYEERLLGGLLQDEVVRKALGDDACWYLDGLLNDERCWNIRNKVCHGLLADGGCTRGMCERVIHALLVIVARTTPDDESAPQASNVPPEVPAK